MEHRAFVTERLKVFRVDCKPNTHCAPRAVFIGFLKADWLGHAIVATVWTDTVPAMGGAYLDWIETTECHRRRGLARELWQGIEKYLGVPLIGEGVSDSGTGLCAAMATACEAGAAGGEGG